VAYPQRAVTPTCITGRIHIKILKSLRHGKSQSIQVSSHIMIKHSILIIIRTNLLKSTRASRNSVFCYLGADSKRSKNMARFREFRYNENRRRKRAEAKV